MTLQVDLPSSGVRVKGPVSKTLGHGQGGSEVFLLHVMPAGPPQPPTPSCVRFKGLGFRY